MKLTVLFLTVAFFNVCASGVSQTVSFSGRNVPLKSVLYSMEKQTGFVFMYTKPVLNSSKPVSISVQNLPLEQFLSQIFNSQPLQFDIRGKNIFLFPKPGSPPPHSNSSATGNSLSDTLGDLKGRVVDENGNSLAGASVSIKNSKIVGMTDAEGVFNHNVKLGDVLIISYVGFQSKDVKVTASMLSGKTLSVILSKVSSAIDEVVVVGYGQRSKRDVTSAISSISSDKISKVVPSSPELLMQGQMSGVQVIGNQGDPNERPTVRIRGTNTWGITDPLYVVDGIPIKEWGAGIEGAIDQYTRGNINVMATIAPSDIESISVLKDASAGAIYGVQAANGVVLITTKKGKMGKASVTYSQRFGIQDLKQKIDLLNTKQFVDFNNALYASDPTSDGSRSTLNEVFRPTSPSYLGNSETYDWQNAIKNRNALTQDYSASVSGGSEKADYYLSLGYSNQESVYITNNLERYSGSFKLNVNINDYIKVGVNYRLSYASARDMNYYMGDLLRIAITPVWQPFYDPNGYKGFAPIVNGYDANHVWNSNLLYGNATRNNMLGYLSTLDEKSSTLRNMGSAYLEIQPLKGLKIRGTFSVDYFDNTLKAFADYKSSYFRTDGGDPQARGGEGSVGEYQVHVTNNLNIVGELSANYTKSFGRHDIDLLFNTMGQKVTVDFSNVGTDYVTSLNPNLINLGGDNVYTRASGFRSIRALQGYLLRGGYNYAGKYYLDATVRRDGSTRFAPSNRFGIFPGLSGAWRISEEAFMKNITWLTDLKFRAGWGKLGNQEVADRAYLSTISESPTYGFGTNPNPRNPQDDRSTGLGYTTRGAAVFGLANPDLQWEKTTTTNIGFDALLFNGLNLSFEYYNKLTDGILQTVTIPPSSGVILMPQGNVAEVRNSGIEVNVNYNKTIGKVNFSLGGNFTTVKNEVERLNGGVPMWNGETGNIEVGQPINFIRGYQVDGIFQSDEEVEAWLLNYNDVFYQPTRIKGGDFYFKDVHGAPTVDDIAKGNRFFSPLPDSIIDAFDQTYIGKTIPGFYYGFYINAEYKGFDFSTQFTGVGDVQKINLVKRQYGMPYGEGTNHTEDVLNAWTPENKNTSVPRMIWADPASNGRFSDYVVENAGYLRLANIQLGYTLPKSAYQATRNVLSNARIYIGCTNLFTITNFGGLDPEDEHRPAPFIAYAGLNVKF